MVDSTSSECAGRERGDFSGSSLRGKDLRFAALNGSRFDAADLSSADLSHARIENARLVATDLSRARLDHAELIGADLTRSVLSAASLRFSNLRDATLIGSELVRANLQYARFDRADLAQADLRDAELDYAVLSGANLIDADLRGANLRYARGLTARQLAAALTDATTVLPTRLQDAGTGANEAPRRETVPAPAAFAQRTRRLALVALASAFVATGFVVTRYLPPVQLGQFAPAQRLARLTPAPAALPPLSPVSLPSRPAEISPADAPPAAVARAVSPSRERGALPTPKLAPPVQPVFDSLALGSGPAAPVLPVSLNVLPVVLNVEASEIPAARPDSLPLVIGEDREIQAVSVSIGAARTVPLAKAMQAEPVRPASFAPETVLASAMDVVETVRTRDVVEDGTVLAPPGPRTLVVSLARQEIELYDGTALLETAKISSGMRGHETPPGVFSILQKNERHASNIYSGAPMPWMQRLTRSGLALHAGVLPGYPASHGCVRLPLTFAKKLYGMTDIGTNVVIASEAAAPRPIEHPTLFQPMRPAAEVSPRQPDRYSAVAGAGSGSAPLRILVARRTARDEVIDVQRILSELGYFRPWKFLGQMEGETRSGISAFQKANGLAATGKISPEFVAKLYQAAGKERPPGAHLFVRQDFHRLYDLPVPLRGGAEPLGTHIFVSSGSQEGRAQWLSLSLEGGASSAALDRIEIPDDVRRDIDARLTPGSTLIVADSAEDSPILQEGDDFIVWAKTESIDAPSAAATAPKSSPPRPATAKVARERPARGKVAQETVTSRRSVSAFPDDGRRWRARPWRFRDRW